jgi:uncharacterized RDD family membrane protein YckC
MTNKLNYAGFWRRLSASLIDVLISLPILISIIYLFGLEKYLEITIDDNFNSYAKNQYFILNRLLIDLISITVVATYSILSISSTKQATIGKRIFNIYVTDINGAKLTRLKATKRFFASIFLTTTTLGIGLLIIAFTKEKTALYDILCATRVIRRTNNE